ISGPATPKPAATTGSDAKCGAANRENSFTIKSNCANSLLANRLRNTGVSVPFFSANNAKLHFVPPTSPARITVPPVLISVANLRRHSRRILWVVPPSTTALQQKLRLSRPPAPRRIYRHVLCVCRAPHIQNWIDQRPRRLYRIASVKQRCIPAHAIAQERCVRAARPTVSERLPITEIHG